MFKVFHFFSRESEKYKMVPVVSVMLGRMTRITLRKWCPPWRVVYRNVTPRKHC
jgi:hypothetical protein